METKEIQELEEMSVPSNHYIIAVDKEQRLGNGYILAPVLKGTEVNDLKPVEGMIVALPMKFTTAFGIASNTPFGGLTAKGLEESVKVLQKGDVVYFSYLACDDENLFDTTEKHYLYRVPVHHLVAVKRGGFFEAVSGKVIIRPEEEKEFESRVLIAVNNRKKIAHGYVVSCSDGMREHFRCGQKVAYMERLAEWIEIDGRKYDFVYTHEILGIL